MIFLNFLSKLTFSSNKCQVVKSRLSPLLPSPSPNVQRVSERISPLTPTEPTLLESPKESGPPTFSQPKRDFNDIIVDVFPTAFKKKTEFSSDYDVGRSQKAYRPKDKYLNKASYTQSIEYDRNSKYKSNLLITTKTPESPTRGKYQTTQSSSTRNYSTKSSTSKSSSRTATIRKYQNKIDRYYDRTYTPSPDRKSSTSRTNSRNSRRRSQHQQCVCPAGNNRNTVLLSKTQCISMIQQELSGISQLLSDFGRKNWDDNA